MKEKDLETKERIQTNGIQEIMNILQIESEIRRAIIALEIAKTNCFDEPMIDKKYNIEKAEQDIIKHTIEYFTQHIRN